jgi:hypothetical protein
VPRRRRRPRAALVAAGAAAAVLLTATPFAAPAGTEHPLAVPGVVVAAPDATTLGRFGWSSAIAADGATAIVGSPQEGSGAARVYTRTGEVWTQQGPKLAAGDGGFGTSVALSGDGETAIAGSPLDGAAWIFVRAGGLWSEGARLEPAGGGGGFGRSVDLSADGQTAVVGGDTADGGTGGAWVFVRDGDSWTQQGARLAPSPPGGTAFGRSLAVSGDGSTLVVGGEQAAWVFGRTGAVWAQEGPVLGRSDGSSGVGGVAVSDDGGTAAVGDARPGFGAAGVWVYGRSDGGWSQQGPRLTGSGGTGERLGYSVALSGDGDVLLAGSGNPAGGVGRVLVFRRGGGGWAQEAQLNQQPDGPVSRYAFGSSVGLSAAADHAVVGGPGVDAGALPAHVWFFSANATPPRAATNVTALPGDGQALVRWTPPSDVNGSGISGYRITARSPSGSRSIDLLLPFGDGGSFAYPSLVNGTTYTFSVQPQNGAGTGLESTPSTPVTPAPVPGAPTAVVATAADGRATVTFTAPASSGGAAITSYTATASPGGRTATGPDSPLAVDGLDNGTSYTFTVVATNAFGDSFPSAPSDAATPVGPPGAPTAVVASAGDGQARVAFAPPASDGGSTIAYYTATASPGGRSASGTGSPITVGGLDDGTSYTFSVTATNDRGTGPSSSPSAAVVPAGPPRPHDEPPFAASRPNVPAASAPAGPRPPRPQH